MRIVKRIFAVLLFGAAAYNVVSGAVPLWLALALLGVLAIPPVADLLARRNPQGIAAQMLGRSVGPRTEPEIMSRSELLRSARSFAIAFAAIAAVYALVFTAGLRSRNDVLLAAGFILVLPGAMCFAATAYLLIRAAFAR